MIGSLLAVLLSYLLGSVCFGILIARRAGINLREHGSGNIGSTNVYRVLGKREGLFTLLGDLLKGTVAVGVARLLTDQEAWLAASAFAAILGHNFPVYFRGKGGKGVATTFGVLFGLLPGFALAMAAVWGAAVYLSRISSVGALSVAVAFPLSTWILERGAVDRWFALCTGLMMLIMHHRNITRLLRGEEKRC